tara:strand:+ start:224 stop:349 length:126 start_codon:yes stop_codon:yes gene_type:complete
MNFLPDTIFSIGLLRDAIKAFILIDTQEILIRRVILVTVTI